MTNEHTTIDDSKQIPLLRVGGTWVQHPQKPSLRFSLRSLFLLVTAAGVLLAICSNADGGGYAPIALLLAISVIVLHLLSTVVGNHLRSEADREIGVFRVLGDLAAAETASLPAADVTPSPLCTHGLGIRWLPMLVIAGAVIGGCLGAFLLEAIVGGQTTAVGIAVGALSTAVLGAWFAFLAGNFWSIVRQGWRDATTDP
jgi:hypothetical protein